PSSRRAWIEIAYPAARRYFWRPVALLAEGVDRNWQVSADKPLRAVALLAEGVDRNKFHATGPSSLLRSPSSRRAWIEMFRRWNSGSSVWVALLAEGVDRNPPSLE